MENINKLINDLSDFLAESSAERDRARDSYKTLEKSQSQQGIWSETLKFSKA